MHIAQGYHCALCICVNVQVHIIVQLACIRPRDTTLHCSVLLLLHLLEVAHIKFLRDVLNSKQCAMQCIEVQNVIHGNGV